MDRPRTVSRRTGEIGRRAGRAVRRLDRSIAIGLAIAAAIYLIAARADGRPTASDNGPTTVSAWSASPLPPGWHQVHRTLTGVLVPRQVFAAATYPIVLHHRPGQCGPPRSILNRMPPDGALLQVIEYPQRAFGHSLRAPRLPRRPSHFTWHDATWAHFECAGPSYKFDYRQSGHALQAQIWLNPTTVAPPLRAGALGILNHLSLVGPQKKERPADLADRSNIGAATERFQ